MQWPIGSPSSSSHRPTPSELDGGIVVTSINLEHRQFSQFEREAKRVVVLAAALFTLGCGASRPLDRRSPPPSGGNESAEPAPELDPIQFSESVFPFLNRDCNSCHQNPAMSFEEGIKFVKAGELDKSVLYRAASGRSHRMIWDPGTDELEALERWILGW